MSWESPNRPFALIPSRAVFLCDRVSAFDPRTRLSPMSLSFAIRDWPTSDRPRERLHTSGPAALSSRELLAILIETGIPAGPNGTPARSAVDVAGDLLRHFNEEGGAGLRNMLRAPAARLREVPGIGPAKAAKILAALELGRRAVDEGGGSRDRIRGPSDVYRRMGVRLRDLPHEEFHVLLVNTRNEILRDALVTRGTLDASLVHPREVFRPAIVEAAAAVILVHNHPSGDPAPSAEDRSVTRQLREAGEQVGIEVLDHVVIGDGRYVSFVESGYWE